MPFFTAKKEKTNNIKNPQSCASCGLYKNCLSPMMQEYGKFRKKIMVIGEAPGAIEDKRNKPWQGTVGRKLQKTFKRYGIDLFNDCLSLNACRCRPKDNETPTDHQIYCCRKKVYESINKYNPHIIVLVGGAALESIIGDKWKKKIGGITKWRGFTIPEYSLGKSGAWVCPIFHPSYVSRNDEKHIDNLAETIWRQDIERIFSLINTQLPKQIKPKINYLTKTKQILDVYKQIKEANLLSFDFETTGLKPERKEQQIVSTSVCFEDNIGYGWLNTKNNNKILQKILSSKTPKTAHNLQFENHWSTVKLETQVNNWQWCSMNAAHVLDNRRGICSLKFQTYINFGNPDYDSLISSFLESPAKEGANALNNIYDFIEKYGEKELLKYNILDSIYGYHLTKLQQGQIL